jgi:hypothetical protein
MFWFALALLCLFVVGSLGALASILRAARGMPDLAREASPQLDDWPLVSIIVPACDEERTIERTLRALRALQYPALEIVAVDDRSTDRTGELMRSAAADDERIVVERIDELPDGWLGKVHAMDRGTKRARGQWLLYMDADVELTPDALARTVAFAFARELDLLSGYPRLRNAGFFVDAAVDSFMPIAALGGKQWAVSDPDSDAYGAFGAFMLVRRAAFERTEGWEWLRLEVADDMGLGLLMKKNGMRCALAQLHSCAAITWYSSVGEMSRLMQKNWFGIMGRFSVSRLLAIALGTLAAAWLPYSGLLAVGAPRLQLLGAVCVALASITGVAAARWLRRAWLPALFPVVGLTLVAGMCLRAAWRGWRIGGIEWRGKLYASRELRAGQRVLL